MNTDLILRTYSVTLNNINFPPTEVEAHGFDWVDGVVKFWMREGYIAPWSNSKGTVVVMFNANSVLSVTENLAKRKIDTAATLTLTGPDGNIVSEPVKSYDEVVGRDRSYTYGGPAASIHVNLAAERMMRDPIVQEVLSEFPPPSEVVVAGDELIGTRMTVKTFLARYPDSLKGNQKLVIELTTDHAHRMAQFSEVREHNLNAYGTSMTYDEAKAHPNWNYGLLPTLFGVPVRIIDRPEKNEKTV